MYASHLHTGNIFIWVFANPCTAIFPSTVCSTGAHLFCTGNLGPTNYACVAVKNRILIYEINRSKLRYELKKVGLLHWEHAVHVIKAVSMVTTIFAQVRVCYVSFFNVKFTAPRLSTWVNSSFVLLQFSPFISGNSFPSAPLHADVQWKALYWLPVRIFSL